VKCRRVGFDDAVNGRLFVRTWWFWLKTIF
jgi:hypothetical protein